MAEAFELCEYGEHPQDGEFGSLFPWIEEFRYNSEVGRLSGNENRIHILWASTVLAVLLQTSKWPTWATSRPTASNATGRRAK